MHNLKGFKLENIEHIGYDGALSIYRQSPVKQQPLKPQKYNFYILIKVPHCGKVT